MVAYASVTMGMVLVVRTTIVSGLSLVEATAALGLKSAVVSQSFLEPSSTPVPDSVFVSFQAEAFRATPVNLPPVVTPAPPPLASLPSSPRPPVAKKHAKVVDVVTIVSTIDPERQTIILTVSGSATFKDLGLSESTPTSPAPQAVSVSETSTPLSSKSTVTSVVGFASSDSLTPTLAVNWPLHSGPSGRGSISSPSSSSASSPTQKAAPGASTDANLSTGMILGWALGGIAVVFCFILFFITLKRRRRQRSSPEPNNADPTISPYGIDIIGPPGQRSSQFAIISDLSVFPRSSKGHNQLLKGHGTLRESSHLHSASVANQLPFGENSRSAQGSLLVHPRMSQTGRPHSRISWQPSFTEAQLNLSFSRPPSYITVESPT